MKRRVAAILFMAAALAVTGCQAGSGSKEPAEDVTETSEAEEAPEAGTEEAEAAEDSEQDPLNALFAETADFPEGTAGSSMKAAELQERFMSTVFVYGILEKEAAQMDELTQSAYDSLDEDQKAAFKENFPAFDEGVKAALEDFESVRSVYDDAGVAESMETLLAYPDMAEYWEVFSASVARLAD